MRPGITSFIRQDFPKPRTLTEREVRKAHDYLRALERVEEWLGDAPEDAGALRTLAAEIHAARVALTALLG